MFRNYLVTAYKVLLRRKFFSFVNLFGIALTLAVLTVVVALLDNYLHPRGAEADSDRFLQITSLALISEDGNSNWVDNPGYRFMQQYVLPLETPELISMFSGVTSGTSFVDGQKHELALKRTDGNYWKILHFTFIEGAALDEEDNAQGRFVAVINRNTRDRIFGARPVLGERLKVNGQQFEIVGVVENEPELSEHAYADVWVPISTDPSSSYRQQMMSGFNALLLAHSPSARKAIQQEYHATLLGFEYEDPSEFATAIGGADTKLEAHARDFTENAQSYDSGAAKFVTALALAMLVFMLLPTINLVNLNTSRILERASEIGVRKAFGASSATLVGQFLVENLVLTLVGGLLGFVLAVLLMDLVIVSDLLRYAQLQVNFRVFAIALLLIGFFGLISGAYPAWRMSRMQPVVALKGA
jgi:putative ABC transport system permease protein